MAAEVKCCVAVTALLVLTCSVAVAQDYDLVQMQKLIGLFEEALVNDDDSLWELQQTFFNPDSKQSPQQVCLSVSVKVDSIANPDIIDCSDIGPESPAFVTDIDGWNWYFVSSYVLGQQVADDASDSSELATLMTESGSTGMFYTMDPTFFSIMKTLSSSVALSIPYQSSYDTAAGSQYRYRASTTIEITITELDEMPCWDDADYALRSVLMWAKFYAREKINPINGTQQCKEETDRSSVSNGARFHYYDTGQCSQSSTDVLIDPGNAWALVAGIFYFSNLLVLTSTLLHFRKVFLWLQQQNRQIKTLYKASAAVLTCVNFIALTSDLYIVIHDTITIWILSFILLGKVPLVVLILILEVPVVCFNTRLANQISTRCQRFAHAFASCQIIWFVHRLVNDTIISVIFFVLAPAQTLGVVTLLLATIASAIAFVAVLIYNFKGCNRQMCTYLICVTVNGVLICGLLLSISLLYLVLVDNGLQSAGMGGLILSLVPPLAVFMIGLIINQKYFKSKRSASSVSTTSEPEEANQTTAIQMDDNEEQAESVPLILQVRARP